MPRVELRTFPTPAPDRHLMWRNCGIVFDNPRWDSGSWDFDGIRLVLYSLGHDLTLISLEVLWEFCQRGLSCIGKCWGLGFVRMGWKRLAFRCQWGIFWRAERRRDPWFFQYGLNDPYVRKVWDLDVSTSEWNFSDALGRWLGENSSHLHARFRKNHWIKWRGKDCVQFVKRFSHRNNCLPICPSWFPNWCLENCEEPA